MAAGYVKAGEAMRASSFNDVVSDLRSQRTLIDQTSIIIKKGGGTNAAGCPFGTIVTNVSGSFIQGGILYAGDKNFNVVNWKLDLATNLEKLIYFEVPVTVNMDDDNEILLPGIETSTWDNITSSWKKETIANGYPNNTAPVIPTGIGKVIIPLGKLTIVTSTSSVTFDPVACGNITANHCAGTLSHSRA